MSRPTFRSPRNFRACGIHRHKGPVATPGSPLHLIAIFPSTAWRRSVRPSPAPKARPPRPTCRNSRRRRRLISRNHRGVTDGVQGLHAYRRHPDVTPSALGCEECLKSGSQWLHLRICRTCGHVGCCDDSPNKHATAHFHATGHPVIEGYDPPEGWGWCYVDEVLFDLSKRKTPHNGTDPALLLIPLSTKN